MECVITNIKKTPRMECLLIFTKNFKFVQLFLIFCDLLL